MGKTYVPDKEKYENVNELIDEFCLKKKCSICQGTDMEGEPNGYGCDGMEAFVEKNSHLIDFDYGEDDECE